MKPISVVYVPKLLSTTDMIAEEELLVIDMIYGKDFHRKWCRLTATMRSPGHDHELVLGLLFSLGIIDHFHDVLAIEPCLRSKLEPDETATITVSLASEREFQPLDFISGHIRYAGCGVCGSHHMPDATACDDRVAVIVDVKVLLSCPEKMAREQSVFQATGGSHGAALFSIEGTLLALFEDVGRHNALDKLIGHCLMNGKDIRGGILVMSSRASFEIVQKAARASLSIVAVMGAVSSLAVAMAEKHGITLVGFLRSERLNVYTHAERIWGL